MRSRKWRGNPPPRRGTAVAARNRRRRRRREALCAASPNRMFPLYYRRTPYRRKSTRRRRSGRIERTVPSRARLAGMRRRMLVGKFGPFFPARKQTASRKPRMEFILCANFRFVENKGLLPKAIRTRNIRGIFLDIFADSTPKRDNLDWEYLNIWKYCKYSDRENKRGIIGRDRIK